MYLSLDPFFYIIDDKKISPIFNFLGVDMLQLIEQVIVKIERISKWQLVR